MGRWRAQRAGGAIGAGLIPQRGHAWAIAPPSRWRSTPPQQGWGANRRQGSPPAAPHAGEMTLPTVQAAVSIHAPAPKHGDSPVGFRPFARTPKTRVTFSASPPMGRALRIQGPKRGGGCGERETAAKPREAWGDAPARARPVRGTALGDEPRGPGGDLDPPARRVRRVVATQATGAPRDSKTGDAGWSAKGGTCPMRLPPFNRRAERPASAETHTAYGLRAETGRSAPSPPAAPRGVEGTARARE